MNKNINFTTPFQRFIEIYVMNWSSGLSHSNPYNTGGESFMTQTTTLACKFKDTEGKSQSININSPSDDLSSGKIIDFMQFVIDNYILVLNDTKPDLKLAAIDTDTVTTKSV